MRGNLREPSRHFIRKFSGLPDNTATLQGWVDALGTSGTLDLGGATYNVRGLTLPSGFTLKNGGLKSIGGILDHVSLVLIDGTAASKSGVTLQLLDLNGNRAAHTSIISQDGDRQGVSAKGYVSNLLIDQCTIHDCATDGIQLYSSTARPSTDASYCFDTITIQSTSVTGCRRHGMSVDSAIRLTIQTGCSFTGNGLDLDTTSALDSGNRGARTGVGLYGNGIDAEGYGLGSAVNTVLYDGVTATGNAGKGLVFIDSVQSRFSSPGSPPAGFAPRSGITVQNSTTDQGIVAVDPDGIVFSPSSADYEGYGTLYQDLILAGNTIAGQVLHRNVDTSRISGGSINAAQYAYSLIAALNVTIGNGGAYPAPTYPNASGVYTASGSTYVYD